MQAIVLDRRDIREYDQIVSLYTRELGKREVLARGVKKILAKQSAFLEPCSVIEADVIRGKQWDHLIRSQPIAFFPSLRKDARRSFFGAYAVLVAHRLVRSHAPDTAIFSLLLGSLRFFAETPSCLPQFLDAYLLKLGGLLGYRPILDRCLLCKTVLKDMIFSDWEGEGSAGFSCAKGGLLCQHCFEEEKNHGQDLLSITLQEVSSMTLFLESDWLVIVQHAISRTEQEHLHRLILSYIRYHSEVRVPDWRPIISSFL